MVCHVVLMGKHSTEYAGSNPVMASKKSNFMQTELLPQQRNRVLAAIQDHVKNNHLANVDTAWIHMKWSFQDDAYWLCKWQIKQLVIDFFKNPYNVETA